MSPAQIIRLGLMIVLPILVLAVGIGAAFTLVNMRPKPQERPPLVPTAPLVVVLPIQSADMTLTVRTQGTVVAQAESAVVPEVPGRVFKISDSLAVGEFVREGQELVWIDPADFELAVANARLALAQAQRLLANEQAEAQVAVQEWRKLNGANGSAEPPALVARKPQMAEAQAAVKAAEEAVRKAERDLRRTVIRAPYDGRVRAKQVDVGQYVSPAVTIARLYSVEAVEVRLPLSVDQLGFLDLPLTRDSAEAPLPVVRLIGVIGGTAYQWDGRIVRTEGEISAGTQMLHVIARVDRPFDADPRAPQRPPLMVGLFVEAEIAGRHVGHAVALPRSAVRTGNRVNVVDEDGRLRFRTISILKSTPDTVVVDAGFSPGDQIVTSPLATAVDGMAVRIVADDASSSADPMVTDSETEPGVAPDHAGAGTRRAAVVPLARGGQQ